MKNPLFIIIALLNIWLIFNVVYYRNMFDGQQELFKNQQAIFDQSVETTERCIKQLENP